MEVSIPRPRARWPAGGRVGPATPTPPQPNWAAERGAACWSAGGEVAGAFPGFTRQGGLLLGSRIRVTERYLLVDEGRAHGFGLPLSAIRDLAIAAAEGGAKPKPVLHLSYDDGRCQRTFIIRPRRDRFGWHQDRFEDALRAFRGAGLEPVARGSLPSLALAWAEARRFRDENVIWSGRATAPLNLLGLRRTSCDVWLTTRSLMWTGGPELGINRVPLARVVDVLAIDLADQTRTPALVAGYLDPLGARRDLVFIFDRHPARERNERERGAILVSLRSRGVGPGAEAGLDQPWRRAWWPEDPAPAATDGGTTTNQHSWPAPPSPAASLPARAPAPALVVTRTCEAEALRLLAEANLMARDLLPAGEFPVPAASLPAALAELAAAAAGGLVTPLVAAQRRTRLLALSEAGSRLRALVRLCHCGQISPDRLEERRLAVLLPLNDLLAESPPGREWPDRAA